MQDIFRILVGGRGYSMEATQFLGAKPSRQLNPVYVYLHMVYTLKKNDGNQLSQLLIQFIFSFVSSTD